MSTSESLETLANDIASGFDALIKKLDEQRRVEADLKEQLSQAFDKINSTKSESPSDGSLSQWQDEIVKQISCHPKKEVGVHTEDPPEFLRARNAIKTLKTNMAQLNARKCPVPHKLSNTEDFTMSTPKQCPVPHKSTGVYEDREKDFTTQGKPSSLECPFAKMTRNGPIDPSSQLDPIAAEFHADSLSAQSLDEARACGRCPMRFMDKHSPEEIAEYFEKHKHELPRSHEICVKRYQKNESSIRQLDEKYGNIVSMIQGLGNKHKQYLRAEDQENQSGTDQKSSAAVAKWAKDIDDPSSSEVVNIEPEARVSHFDKPLPDIRVGESPSRPWGISMPVNRPRALSAASSSEAPSELPKQPEQDSVPKKATADLATPPTVQSRPTASAVSTSQTRRSRGNQVIFNGPVFLGYSAEQAAVFIQQLGEDRRT